MPHAYTPKTKQFDHQRLQLEKHGDKPAWGLLWEQGTGKTKELLDEIAMAYLGVHLDGVIVLAPNGVERNWITDEMPTHLPERVLGVSKAAYWQTQKAATKWHAKQMQELLRHEGLAWLMMSYDAIMTDAGRDMVWAFLQQRRCAYVLDEAHHIKTPGAKRTKRVIASGKYASFRRIATGTPTSTGPFDIYSQVRFLQPDFWSKRGIANFAAFKAHFGEWLTASEFKEIHGYDPGFDKLIRYRNVEQLEGWLKETSSRVLKDDVLDLPPKLYSKRYFDLTPTQSRMLDELKANLVTTMESGKRVEAPLAIVQLLRAQQITCGYAVAEAGDTAERLPGPNPRLAVLRELVESTHTPGIIWARFRPDIDLIMELLAEMGETAVRYDGALTEDECMESKRAFQHDPNVKWFVGNPAKGKEGLTLLRARNVFYYSNSFKLIDRLQSEDRCHRIGQEHPVRYVDIVTPRVDDHIVKALRTKFDIASQITGDRLREWL
jgi:hypothetical protein